MQKLRVGNVQRHDMPMARYSDLRVLSESSFVYYAFSSCYKKIFNIKSDENVRLCMDMFTVMILTRC